MTGMTWGSAEGKDLLQFGGQPKARRGIWVTVKSGVCACTHMRVHECLSMYALIEIDEGISQNR